MMVVISTKKEYANSPWVKNEWSRFLTLINEGQKKILIPAYRDMDPYDLPDEFVNFQAQDMSKLGFMQDLLRGIKKIIGGDQNPSSNSSTRVSENDKIHSLLKRVKVFTDDEEWEMAQLKKLTQKIGKMPKSRWEKSRKVSKSPLKKSLKIF